MKKITVFVLIFCAFAAPSFAQKAKLVVKLASLAPEATPWGEALNNLAKQWGQVTNGEIELRIYHNGVAGGESDVLRKLKGNQIQAAVFTSIGMSQISPAIMTLSVPFFIRTDDELNAVLAEMRTDLEKGIEDAGFKTIAWSKVGWVNFFSRYPVRVPDDLKKQKLAADPSMQTFNDAFRMMGYQITPSTTNDTIVFLNSRTIDAIWQSPINVAATQAFGIAKNMADIKIAPFMGGIVMNEVTWRKIPEKYRPRLLALSGQTVAKNETSITRLEEYAISQMKANGLIINTLSEDDRQAWYADVQKVMPSLLGKTFDRDLYVKIDAILRKKRGG